ncbi:alcohol dehydrogenase [Salinarchaeum sp. Harcht-Bsk1]|uniref:alcohol dehydrogenase catalytic domain-containing protein n=1 Tax=Salinarchaeum sp. Harcht-Bsk1 TaxID=1333523 RepID=UPI0003423B97|nr:alcohol dehydrogenase catalytic domain-containing protein [Salinarchaeum sp. Harcht-Bsk1]AGN01554.1 alcohol dehydrogenase [Salinarchaeum sp. Harcht-Bsk1]
MRAATLTDVGDIAVEERDRPVPGPEEVLVEVGACGVCMTDFHMYHGTFAADLPVVPGHEAAGEVVAVGDDVRATAVGERVAVNPTVACNACSACKRGDTHLCANNTSIGGAADRVIDGAFAEFVRVPASNVEPIGDLPAAAAALAEPLACCVHGADRTGLQQGDSAALIGAGPIGLLLVQTLRNRGVSPIAVSEPDDERRALAAEFGADLVVDPTETDPVETIATEVGRVDAAIEAVGRVATLEQAHDLTGPGGATLVFGVPPEDAKLEVRPFEVFFEEVDLRGSYSLTQASFERAVELIRRARIDTASLVTDEIGLGELPAAFERMERGEGLRHVVRPGR